MSLVGKIFAVIAMVVAVFYAGITATLVSLQENYKLKWVSEQALHKQTEKKKNDEIADLQSQYKQLDGEHHRVRKELERVVGENTNLRNEWAESAAINRFATAIINDQEEHIKALNARIDRYNDDLKAQRGDNDQLQAKLDDLEAKRKDLLANRDSLQDKLTVRENDLGNAMKTLKKVNGDLAWSNDIIGKLKEQRPDIYDNLIRGEIVEPKDVIRGKVTGVDKSLGLVIVNVGQRHEVQKGYSFIVFRGDQYIGKIVIDEVFPDMAAGHYDKPAMKTDVEVGDDVTTKLTVEL